MTNLTANFPNGDPVDPNGRLTPQWRAFFLSLFARTGGATGDDSGTIRSDLDKAIANIKELQAETQQGEPSFDVAAVYSMIYAIEAIAAQAMAATLRAPDERGESGEANAVSVLTARLAEIESQIEHYRSDDALRQRVGDLESKIESIAPTIGDASQLTGLGTFATQNYATPPALGQTTPNLAAFTYLTLNSATTAQADLQITNTLANGAQIKLTGNGATTPAKTIRVNSGVLQVMSSGYGLIMSLDDPGNLTVTGGFSFSPATTTTAPAAGGAGALPATPAGYATVTVGGTARKIPYY